ncbi:MAG: SprT family zinc-dependent metalloprotease [Planctomycetota bacterium]
MATTLELGGTSVDVVRRDIKRVQLTVHPPTGRVRIAAPGRVALETLRLFAIAKLPWIRRQQHRMQGQVRETRRDFVDRESHYVWGRRYLMKVIEGGAAGVDLRPRTLLLAVRPGASTDEREAVLAKWYRRQVHDAAQVLLERWARGLGVEVRGLRVRRMKTKWGSCSPNTGTVLLNTELAKKPAECLHYVVAHELLHLIDRSHGPRFVAMLDRLMPRWRDTREMLNRLPLRAES